MKKKFILFFIFLIPIFATSETNTKSTNVLPIKTEITVEPDTAEIFHSTFLGDEKRRSYGEGDIHSLRFVTNFNLGKGFTIVRGTYKAWFGTGWTGQPSLVYESNKPYIVIGSYDHHLRRIDVEALLSNKHPRELTVWKYEYPDVVKGSPTVYIDERAPYENRVVALHGCRYGKTPDNGVSVHGTKYVWSFRAVSFRTGEELWRMNSEETISWSRDNDSSPLILSDKNMIFNANENGIGYFLSSGISNRTRITNDKRSTNFYTQKIYARVKLFDDSDAEAHGGEITAEASASRLYNTVFMTTSAGHMYGINMSKLSFTNASKIQAPHWDLKIGSDIDGSAAISKDEKIFCTVEKEFIEGKGGLLKVNPKMEEDESIEWFFPTGTKNLFNMWAGGIVGSASINDEYNTNDEYPPLVAIQGIDGYLYVLSQNTLDEGKLVLGPNKKHYYKTPKLVYKNHIAGSISTPIFTKNNKIIGAGYDFHIYLYDIKYEKTTNGDPSAVYNKSGVPYKVTIEVEDKFKAGASIEATPLVWKNYVFVACRDGFLYVLGGDDKPIIKPETNSILTNISATNILTTTNEAVHTNSTNAK